MAHRTRVCVTARVMAFATLIGPLSAYAAKQIVVTSTGDSPSKKQPPPPGSQREAIEVLAAPGDVITFNVAGPVVLERTLQIPLTLWDLTIRGPAVINGGGRAAFQIQADHVALNNLTFDSVEVMRARKELRASGSLSPTARFLAAVLCR